MDAVFPRSPALGGIARALEPSSWETGHGHFTAIFRKRTGLPPVPGATERDSGSRVLNRSTLASPAGRLEEALRTQENRRGDQARKSVLLKKLNASRRKLNASRRSHHRTGRLKALLKQSGIDRMLAFCQGGIGCSNLHSAFFFVERHYSPIPLQSCTPVELATPL